MTVVLLATGLFVYRHVQSEVDEEIGLSLRARANDVAALARHNTSPGGKGAGARLRQQEQSPAQILDAEGRVYDATAGLRRRPLLTRRELAAAVQRSIRLDRASAPGIPGPVRLLAMPVRAGERRLVVVVAASLHDQHEELESLVTVLSVGGPIAALLASLLGYGVAVGALRPVELMRRKAAAISADDPQAILPVPPGRDEIGRLGETLNQMLGRLSAAFQRERTFVADASHELRTPLAILKAELDLALRSPVLDQPLRQALLSATEEADRLVALADDLLVLSSSDDGRLPLHLSEVRVADVLANARTRFMARSQAAGRAITVAPPPSDQRVIGDPARLQQAIGNLVDNALRYGDGAVRLTAEARNGRVELHVADDGRGFPSELLDHAFDRFARADSARSRGGTGLGLAIARAIAVAHGGDARARNRRGQGADVWISLPASPKAGSHGRGS